MYNYYNIIPIILLDVFIILVFEGLLFYFYLLDSAEKSVKLQLDTSIQNASGILSRYQNQLPPFQMNMIHSKITPAVQKSLIKAMENEKQYVADNKTKSIKIYLAILITLALAFIIYVYIVQYRNGKYIDWWSVGIVVSLTILLIIIMEMLYVFMILFKKKFNDSEIKLAFINALQ